MRRTLVLTDETARHPFLGSLPPHIRRGEEAPRLDRRAIGITAADWRDFLMAYCAMFLAVSLYIS